MKSTHPSYHRFQLKPGKQDNFLPMVAFRCFDDGKRIDFMKEIRAICQRVDRRSQHKAHQRHPWMKHKTAGKGKR